MGARENECQISQNYILHMKFLEYYPYMITIVVKFDIMFLDFSEKFSLVFLQMIYYIKPLKNVKKEMQHSLNYSGTRILSTES